MNYFTDPLEEVVKANVLYHMDGVEGQRMLTKVANFGILSVFGMRRPHGKSLFVANFST